MKTNKALKKRIKITGGHKLMKRPPGQNHFNAKDSGNAGQMKKGQVRAPKSLTRIAKALIKNL